MQASKRKATETKKKKTSQLLAQRKKRRAAAKEERDDAEAPTTSPKEEESSVASSSSSPTSPLPGPPSRAGPSGDEVEAPADSKLHTAPMKRTRVVRMQRKGGRVVQDCDVYIGRRWTMGGWDLPQSKWANPFSVKKHAGGSAAEAVRMYEEHLRQQPDLMASLGELRGKVLGCWCKKKPSDPCHGDVLARLADESG